MQHAVAGISKSGTQQHHATGTEDIRMKNAAVRGRQWWGGGGIGVVTYRFIVDLCIIGRDRSSKHFRNITVQMILQWGWRLSS